jgi:hypothetical protein
MAASAAQAPDKDYDASSAPPIEKRPRATPMRHAVLTTGLMRYASTRRQTPSAAAAENGKLIKIRSFHAPLSTRRDQPPVTQRVDAYQSLKPATPFPCPTLAALTHKKPEARQRVRQQNRYG